MCLALMMLLQGLKPRQRVYFDDGRCLVSVRYPWQWHDIRSFITPENPAVQEVYSQIGPDAWALYDFVCLNVQYVADFGEWWKFPSETLRGYGDCEDCANLLTSLLKAGGIPAYTALGSYAGYGHAWCQQDGQILETTYTWARPVPDPENYCPYVLFNNEEVIELWPNALGELFSLRRDEATKLKLMAEVLDGAF